jgi:DNA-binding MarR family transcriptional regulator
MENRKKLLSEIMANIQAMKNRMHGEVAQQGKHSNITYSQWCVLAMIEKNQTMGINDIAKMLSITASATTQLVDGLVKNGYVQRKINKLDRRSSQIVLSRKGKKSIAKMKATHMKAMEKVFEALSNKELKTYNALHKKILKSLSLTD